MPVWFRTIRVVWAMRCGITPLSFKPRPGKPSLAFCRASPLSRLGTSLRRVAGLAMVRGWFFGLRGVWGLLPRFSEGLVAAVLVSSGVGREAEVGVQGLQAA